MGVPGQHPGSIHPAVEGELGALKCYQAQMKALRGSQPHFQCMTRQGPTHGWENPSHNLFHRAGNGDQHLKMGLAKAEVQYWASLEYGRDVRESSAKRAVAPLFFLSSCPMIKALAWGRGTRTPNFHLHEGFQCVASCTHLR